MKVEQGDQSFRTITMQLETWDEFNTLMAALREIMVNERYSPARKNTAGHMEYILRMKVK